MLICIESHNLCISPIEWALPSVLPPCLCNAVTLENKLSWFPPAVCSHAVSLGQVLQGSQVCASFPWESPCLPNGDTATCLSTRGDVPLPSAVTRRRPGTGGGAFPRHSLLYSVCEGRPRGRKSLAAATGGCVSVSRGVPAVLCPCFRARGGAAAGGGAGPRSPAPLCATEVTAWAPLLFRHQNRSVRETVHMLLGRKAVLGGGSQPAGFRVTAFGGSVWRSGHLVWLSVFVPSVLAAAPRHTCSLMHFSPVWWLVMQYIAHVSEMVHQAGTTSMSSSLDTAKLGVDKALHSRKSQAWAYDWISLDGYQDADVQHTPNDPE